MQHDFHGMRVLVVEDNYLVANEIVDALEAANAIVVGPCSTLDDAEMQIAHSDLAMLDVDIRGRSSFALADRLTTLDVPYVFFTGLDRALLPERFAKIDVITKPVPPEVAVQKLEMVSRDSAPCSIIELIPMLRMRARSILSDPLAADRLVERTLQLAIDDPAELPKGSNLVPWLLQRMDWALDGEPMQFLN
jgi:DNA-binding response OmpR family regulator